MRLTIEALFASGKFWRLDSALDGPWVLPSAQSAAQKFLFYATRSGKIGECVCRSAPFKENVRNAIVRLFLLRRPTHVAGLIVSGVVNAIKRVVSSRPLPHISEKTCEVAPALTESYSALFVMLKGWTGWNGAARDHIPPRPISWRGRVVGGMPVYTTQASAGSCMAGGQIIGANYLPLSTRALAGPKRTALTRSSPSNYSPGVKSSARDVLVSSASSHSNYSSALSPDYSSL